MKKIIISLFAIIALLFTGCFVDSDTATVRINLGNLPIAKVEKKSLIDRFFLIFAKEAVAQGIPQNIIVHLGAFDSNNQLLAKKSISNDNYPGNNIVEFDVPARSGVTIVVLGEGELPGPVENIYEISHYGKSDSLNLTTGVTKEVPIEMGALNNGSIDLKEWYYPYEVEIIEWKKLTGASLYKIYDPDDQLVLSTDLNSFKPEEGNDYSLRIEFGFIGKLSNSLDFNYREP